MKNAERLLRTSLTESLQLSLTGLNEKHTKKLRKTVDRAVNQLARRFSKLTAKEQKNSKESAAATPSPAPLKLATRTTRTAAKRPAAAKATTPK